MTNVPPISGSNLALGWNMLRDPRTDQSCKTNEVHIAPPLCCSFCIIPLSSLQLSYPI